MSNPTNHYHTKIGDVGDSEFRQLIGEICRLAKWRVEDAETGTLFNLLQFIGAEKRPIRFGDIPRPGILATRLNGLPCGVVRELCGELTKSSPGMKTVFSVIKEAIYPKNRLKRMTVRRQMDLEQMHFILQQRANRTL